MVYITSSDGTEKKYACIQCIKGHRSTKCKHSDRDLFEIKRKGRPVSQCENCRLLRKTKQIHTKCVCQSKIGDNIELIFNNETPGMDISSENVNSCKQCNRSNPYCICPKTSPLLKIQKQESLSSSSSDGSITPPIQLGYPKNLVSHTASISAAIELINSANSTNETTNQHNTVSDSLPAPSLNIANQSKNQLKTHHLTIPIHDPFDDIDSDTPIYKPVEEADASKPSLGEFTNKSSDELMTQIYSRFDPSNASSNSLLKADDDQFVELSTNP